MTAPTLRSLQTASDTSGEAEAEFNDGLVRFLPNLTAFACSLCRDVNRADDLVQETIMKALANREKFKQGSNQLAWLFTILRNVFLSEIRKSKSFASIAPQLKVHRAPVVCSNQDDSLELGEVVSSIGDLPPQQQRAVKMIGVWGFSYEEAAEVENCAVGTVKSRVSRARAHLATNLKRSAS